MWSSMRGVVMAAVFAASAAEAHETVTRGADEANTIEVFRRARPGVVHVDARVTRDSKFDRQVVESGTGSGFLVDAEGHVLTNYHVVRGQNEVDVVLDSGRRLAARIVGTAPQLDLALLAIDVPAEEPLAPLPLGTSAGLEVGQKVLAIGNPFGLHDTLTVGVISALERRVEGAPMELEDVLIQTDAAINPGNSGGPLLDSGGRVIGINTLGSNAQSLGFAVPIGLARRVIADLVAMGHPYHPQLGFDGWEITPALARLFGLPVEHGVVVESVLPRSPAAAAGLRSGERLVAWGDRVYVLGGDIIVSVDGQPLSTRAQFARALLLGRPGEHLKLQVLRDGVTEEITIQLTEMFMGF